MSHAPSSSSSSSSSLASGPNSLHGLDLSHYQQPALVEAFGRLTSPLHLAKLMVKPSLKIMWRSALYQDGQVRWQELMSKLSGPSPVTEPPLSHPTSHPTPPSSLAPAPIHAAAPHHRSIAERITHFFFVGIPLAFLVGIAFGIVNFVTAVWNDIVTVASLSTRLFNQAKNDLSFYLAHPESRPTKDEAVNAWSAQIVQPYTQQVLKSKLGFFGFQCITGPIANIIHWFVTRAAKTSATQVQKYAKKYKNFDVFRSESESASASAYEASAPSAPAPDDHSESQHSVGHA